ncbi:HEAT repeat-containing protein 6 [Eurosta solidaginis]|uniref:HEAT repeat-containing protein 6 n=1 Tax=Eurosta solidaginis TaxID=178769 RepID=UPI00353086B1
MSIGKFDLTENKSEYSNIGNIDIFNVMSAVELTDGFVIGSILDLISTVPTDYWNGSSGRVKLLLKWLMDVYSKHEAAECHTLRAITKIIKCFAEYRMLVLMELFCPQSLIYSRTTVDGVVIEREQFVQSVLDCIGVIFNDVEHLTLSNEQVTSSEAVLKLLCQIQYSGQFKAPRSSRIIFQSIILFKKLLSLCKNVGSLYMGEVLGICMTYMFVGNAVKEGKVMRPHKVLPSSIYIKNVPDKLDSANPELHSKTCGKFVKEKKKRGNSARCISSEESETCITETEKETIVVDSNEDSNIQQIGDKNEINVKIRIASINLFGDIVRCVQQRVLYLYWRSLFPWDIEENKYERSDIFYVAETDENSKCRCAALEVCVDLCLIYKSLFCQAEYIYRTATFMPLSQTLGLTILSSFRSLMLTITKEVSIPVLIQALKCTSALVQATAITKFECGVICDLISVLKNLVYHKDSTVQLTALTVVECVLMESTLPTGVVKALYSCKDDKFDIGKSKDGVDVTLNYATSWLTSNVLYNLGYIQGEWQKRSVKIPNPLRLKSFQLLSTMALHLDILLMDILDDVVSVLEEGLKDNQLDIRLGASKCLDALAYQIGTIAQSTTIDKCIRFWIHILPSIMKKIQIENELCAVKIALVNAISNIGTLVFENLPQSIRISLLSFLTGLSSETTEDVIVRANVVRALSIFATFPSMRINLVYIENTADLLLRLADVNNMSVRIKIIWSMGNISEALLENSFESSNERISDDILWSLTKLAIEACNNNDKVRCNAVRTIGNLMRLISEKHFLKHADRALLTFGINKLVDGILSPGSSKVKWNSCYAIGNVLQSERIFLCMDMHKYFSCKSTLYSALCHAICCNSNYKVKINATTALLHIKKRSYIGEYCGTIWKTIIEAIEQSHNLFNFYEYNHRDLLQEQLLLLLCHIINLATVDDYILFSRIMLKRTEVVRNTWVRVTRRMIPEKAAPLLVCSSQLYKLLKSNTLNPEQKCSVKLIFDVLPLNN